MFRLKSVSVAIALLLPTFANAATWYMTPTGTGNCSSWAAACKDLSVAVSKIAASGDQIFMAKGSYKFSSTLTNASAYSWNIYGGFEGTETDIKFRDAIKNPVIISPNGAGYGLLKLSNRGVSDVSPTSILDSVTITGVNANGAVGAEGAVHVLSSKLKLNKVKFSANRGHAPGLFITGALSKVEATEVEFLNNIAEDTDAGNGSSVSSGGAVYMADAANALFSCEKCNFKSNSTAAGNGGAVYASSGIVKIALSAFESNSAVFGGAVAFYAIPFEISSTLFNLNAATTDGGGAYIQDSSGSIVSSTFYENQTRKLGGAIANSGSAIDLFYSTIYKNKTMNSPGAGGDGLGAGLAIWLGPLASFDLKANIIMGNYNNVTNETQNIWRLTKTTNPIITDSGYNIIGFGTAGLGAGAGLWEGIAISGQGYVPQTPTALTFATLFPTANTTKTSHPSTVATANTIIEVTLADNGGYFKSLKLAPDSIAKNAIPNDVPTTSVGLSPSTPFTSIAEARGALESYPSYGAGKYFFNINGTPFATYVDKEGYVLVASSDSGNVQASPYTKVSTLTKRSDAILTDAIMAKFTTTEISEVRISSDSNGTRGTFDMVSTDVDVINSLRQYKTLNNPGSGGVWQVRSSSKGVNYGTGTSWAGSTLDAEIYQANGQTGIFWVPSIPKEALVDPGANQASIQDNLDLWVRSSKGVCNGSVKMDQRGLPRSDFVNPDDPNQYGVITACDIGSFEWNNGYQLDCWDEDGLRPENSISGGQITVCFSDPKSISPKSLINNFGYADKGLLVFLTLMMVWRASRKGLVIRSK